MNKISSLVSLALLSGIGVATPEVGRCDQRHAGANARRAPAYLKGDEARTASLYESVLPTVVTILTSRHVLSQEGRQQQRALGSGVVIFPDCHVLTAAHVVAGADEIMVKTWDGKTRPAELLFSESSADLALLRFLTPEPALEHARLGDSDRLAVGQRTYVVGSPYGLENSLSVGHVSGFRDFGRLHDGTILLEFIQTDAAINSGNSGGPVFNSKGEVIGISSRILTVSGGFQGLGFVLAINTAKQLLAFIETSESVARNLARRIHPSAIDEFYEVLLLLGGLASCNRAGDQQRGNDKQR